MVPKNSTELINEQQLTNPLRELQLNNGVGFQNQQRSRMMLPNPAMRTLQKPLTNENQTRKSEGQMQSSEFNLMNGKL